MLVDRVRQISFGEKERKEWNSQYRRETVRDNTFICLSDLTSDMSIVYSNV